MSYQGMRAANKKSPGRSTRQQRRLQREGGHHQITPTTERNEYRPLSREQRMTATRLRTNHNRLNASTTKTQSLRLHETASAVKTTRPPSAQMFTSARDAQPPTAENNVLLQPAGDVSTAMSASKLIFMCTPVHVPMPAYIICVSVYMLVSMPISFSVSMWVSVPMPISAPVSVINYICLFDIHSFIISSVDFCIYVCKSTSPSRCLPQNV